MGLSVLSALPDPQEQFRSLQQELFNRNRQLHEMEMRARNAEEKVRALESGLIQLRQVLTPLHNALNMVFGEIEAAGVSGAAPAQADSRVSAIWESWKSKLPSGQAKAIDALLLHGSMTTAQLRIHIGCATRTAINIVAALKSKGLIVKNGAVASLKQM